MRFAGAMRSRNVTAAALWLAVIWFAAMPQTATAATGEPTDEQIGSAPCLAAVTAGDDEKVIAVCVTLIGNDKAPKADRVKALIARAAAYERKGEIDRAIGDDDIALRLDPTLADVFNARGELFRRKGDRVHALADFAAAVKLNPNHAAARASYKSLSLEVERIGALMAVNNRPSFNCAAARRAVEKAICANPELANLDREINAVNTRVVREAGQNNPRAGRAMQREQDDFLARRNAEFGRPGFDLQKTMRERLDYLLAVRPN
jgi:tetratricopeptide (TPR) repeat protein